MTLPVARIGDVLSLTDVIATGSGNVFINNIPCATLSSITTGHTLPGHGFYPPTVITTGSGSVFINGLPIARVSDTSAGHTDTPHPPNNTTDFHTEVITTGSGNVFAGG